MKNWYIVQSHSSFENKVAGLKLFLGSSTGNMLVDNKETLTNIFSNDTIYYGGMNPVLIINLYY